jgi:ABC-type lipoprotein release transport system permease subunit
MQKGTFGNMIDKAVKLSTGYIQIHKNGYWEDQSINETFEFSDQIKNSFNNNKNVTYSIPRLESFALASSGNNTKGAIVKGTVPEIEDELNKYSDKIVKGEFLKSGDQSILVGEELANYLKVDVGDSLVMLGQGYHGITAAAQYPIKGILHIPIPQLNRQMILMPLEVAQYFYASENRLTSISLMLKDPELLESTREEIFNNLNNSDSYEVMTWQEMNKELVQFVDTKNVGSIIMLSILYIVVGFGVFGTIMMMTMERRKEFAILVSIGMHKVKLLLIVFWETLLIGFCAVLIGILLAFPLLNHLVNNPILLSGEFAESMKSVGAEPIMPFVVNPNIFINQTLTVILIAFIAVIYPLFFILKFDVLKAMKN